MPDDDFGIRNRPHIQVDAFREQGQKLVRGAPRNSNPLRDDYRAHADLLLNQLAAAMEGLPLGERLDIPGLGLGVNISISTLPPTTDRMAARRVPVGFDFSTQDIAVLRTERRDDRTETAVVFVPDAARNHLRQRLDAYGRNPGNQGRPDVDRFEVIETIQAAPARLLFTGPTDFDAPDPIWWELWVRESDGRADQVAAHARAFHLDVHGDRLRFPDTTVIFVHGPAARIAAFADRVPGSITEIRRSVDTIEPILDRNGMVLPQDWVDDLAGRIIVPVAGAPIICALDTGIAGAHPLLAPVLAGASAVDAAWGADDHDGHGTNLAGLAAYGDLFPHMTGGQPVRLVHRVQSVKLLPPRPFPATQPASYGFATQSAVAIAEIDVPHDHRSFCLALSATDFPPDRPSSWSGALDQIAAGSMPGDRVAGVPAPELPKRLVLVAAGNVWEGDYAGPAQCEPIEDPAQSWNALTIGGYTAKDIIPPPPPLYTPAVPANHKSPYSRGSRSLPTDLTPIKPEVLFEAGNPVRDAAGAYLSHEATSVLTTGRDVVVAPLEPFWATSAATGIAGRFIGQLHAAHPEFWPETVRALTVDSASWTAPMRQLLVGRGAHWKTSTKKERIAILREIGYGVPDLDRAIASASNDVTLIAQAEIQPFAVGAAGGGVFNEIHFYDLPWPRAALQHLENAIVTMKVTLSYFVEPNLAGRAATRPATYRSFGLRFAMKRRTETIDDFKARLAVSEDEDDLAPAAQEADYWLLGPKAVEAGSLHCDLWRGAAVDLAAHDCIAIFPVGGWWKSHQGQRRITERGRYALTVSISAPDLAVDLYSEIEAQVAVLAGEVDIEVGAQPPN